MASVKPKHSLLLDQPPDCVEFVPTRPDTFVIGTYALESDGKAASSDDGQNRSGTLVLCRLTEENIIKQHVTSTRGGAYDLHFLPPQSTSDTDILGVSTSTGIISLYAVTEQIIIQRHFRVAAKDVLITSFAWHPTEREVLAASLSTGEVVICSLRVSGDEDRSSSDTEVTPVMISKHSEAAWHVAWTPTGKTLLHGGDDGVLGWCQTPLDIAAFLQQSQQDFVPGARDRRVHEAGVTAILPLDDEWVFTGSYDDRLRVVKLGQRAVSSAELKFGDGVFRLRFLRTPQKLSADQAFSALILASCMRSGTWIVEVARNANESGTWRLRAVAAFTDIESLNYASASSNDSIVSLSFYERTAFHWGWNATSDI